MGKQLDGTMVKAEISPIDSYKRDKGHKDWEKSQSGDGVEIGEIDSGMGGIGIDGMGVGMDGNLGGGNAGGGFSEDRLNEQFEGLCSISETRETGGAGGGGQPIQS